MEVPVMPEFMRGGVIKKSTYTSTTPKKWTDNEINWALKLKEDGYNVSQIASSMNRSEVSVQIKLKRIGKKT